jgi:hypothetical protein
MMVDDFEPLKPDELVDDEQVSERAGVAGPGEGDGNRAIEFEDGGSFCSCGGHVSNGR